MYPDKGSFTDMTSTLSDSARVTEQHEPNERRQGGHLEVDEQSFELSNTRLSFRDPGVERRFSEETFMRSINLIRAYLIAGTLLYVIYGFLDRIVGGEATLLILAIRYAFVCPILLIIFAFTFSPLFPRYGQIALSIAMLVTGFGVVAMTAVMAPPFNSEYYAGLIMVVIYCGSLIRLKFLYGLAITLVLVASYQLSAAVINPIPIDYYISNNFFLIMASGVGLFSSYIQELYFRRTYISGKIVETKNEYTNVLLRESQRANRSKDQFLANMSHELRTPLNAIIGFSEILKRQAFGPLGNTKYAEYADDINNSGSRLLQIINDILDLAKADAGKIDLREDDVDVDQLLRECVHICENRAGQGLVSLEYKSSSTRTHITVDERLIRQVILNLLSNALKFTPEGGKVTVSFTASEYDGIDIKIHDTGIGISREDLERVQRPFEQVEGAYARKTGGAGLGLPLAVKLTELHGGRLTIDSEQGKGTTIDVLLPANRVRQPREEHRLPVAV
jgi:two-component system cell cycle sensor histidine kinase PleC